MNSEYIHALFEYHDAANQQLWGSILRLSDDQFVHEPGYSIGSVRNHVVHVMDVDQRWLRRIKGEPLGERLVWTDFTTPSAAQARWNEIEAGVLADVRAFDDAALSRVIDYDLPQRGGPKHNPVWQILAHVVNHGTDHRAQVLRLLWELGAPTFEQDLIIHLWTR